MNDTNRTSNRQLAAALSRAVSPPGGGDLESLRSRLADDAAREGVLDVAYRIVDTPYGPMLVAASAVGIVRLAFEREDHDAVLDRLGDEISPRILRTPRRTDDAARQLDEYFSGRRRRFDLSLDLRLVSGFRLSVISHLREIAYGSTESYAAVAAATGRPAAVRAVGTACGHNPLPIVVPCHRVVRSDGTTGQYGGGAEVKAALLSMETAR